MTRWVEDAKSWDHDLSPVSACSTRMETMKTRWSPESIYCRGITPQARDSKGITILVSLFTSKCSRVKLRTRTALRILLACAQYYFNTSLHPDLECERSLLAVVYLIVVHHYLVPWGLIPATNNVNQVQKICEYLELGTCVKKNIRCLAEL